MDKTTRNEKRLFLLSLLVASRLVTAGGAWAVEVGDKAPEFKLPATTGLDISLADFRGKKWVFLEFYGAAFVPT